MQVELIGRNIEHVSVTLTFLIQGVPGVRNDYASLEEMIAASLNGELKFNDNTFPALLEGTEGTEGTVGKTRGFNG